MADRRRGQIWEYFDIKPDDNTLALCKTCQETVKRGKLPKDFSTTPLINHLRLHHSEIHQKFLEKKDETIKPVVTKPASNQITIAQSFEISKKWG